MLHLASTERSERVSWANCRTNTTSDRYASKVPFYGLERLWTRHGPDRKKCSTLCCSGARSA